MRSNGPSWDASKLASSLATSRARWEKEPRALLGEGLEKPFLLSQGVYTILYDDEDQEEVNLHEEVWRYAAAPGQAAAATRGNQAQAQLASAGTYPPQQPPLQILAGRPLSFPDAATAAAAAAAASPVRQTAKGRREKSKDVKYDDDFIQRVAEAYDLMKTHPDREKICAGRNPAQVGRGGSIHPVVAQSANPPYRPSPPAAGW